MLMASIFMATDPIDAIRAFNRTYTQRIGVLHEKHLHSEYSLTQVRLLYELAHRDHVTSAELSRDLGLDPGYLSRTLTGFQNRGLIQKHASHSDRRESLLSLTTKGRRAFAVLEDRARQNIAQLLARIPDFEQPRLVEAIRTAHEILEPTPTTKPAYILRHHRPGDMGWVIQRHGALYSREYGWGERFESLVARITADFIDNFDAKCERCWIAEIDGRNVGSVFLVKKTDEIAKLRLLLVEPDARGLGIGSRLVAECIRFAQESGYRKITLWTHSNLTTARAIYERAGFQRIHEEPNDSFGQHLTSETWDLKL